MSWVKQYKLLAVEAIQYQGLLCNFLPNLWHALYWSYNVAANHPFQLNILDDVSCLASWPWVSFFILKLNKTLKACFNISALDSDYVTWCYFKSILANNICAAGILSLANFCITLWHWSYYFKESVSVIIPKPGKLAYNTSKAF